MKSKKSLNRLAIIAELNKRKKEVEELANKPKFKIEEYCFDKQIEFINDKSKFKTAVCSRRSGKSVSCSADLVNTAISNSNVNVLYLTLNRLSAKRIIWKELLKVNKDYNLKGKVNESELTLTFDNGSVIYVSGANDASQVDKFRGLSLYKVYIDEAQSFRGYLQNLIDDVLVPALYDHDGSLILIGTPGPVCAGTFYEASHNEEWSNHRWTIFQNPWIEKKSGKKVEDILANERKRRGITESDPTYRRESLGEWVQDIDALVFKFNKDLNITSYIPPHNELEFIFGIDIGWNDADAIAVLGYHKKSKKVYIVEEWVKNKQTITALVNKIEQLKEKYNPIHMVMDAGALGKKIQEEIRFRHGIHIEAAEKQRKFEFIELLNDDLRTAKFKALPKSRFEEDANLVQWNYDNPDKPKVADTYHSDIADAVLYAWRQCKHYLSTAPEPKLSKNSDAYMDKLEKQEAEKQQYRNENPDWQIDEAFEQDINDLDQIIDEWEW